MAPHQNENGILSALTKLGVLTKSTSKEFALGNIEFQGGYAHTAIGRITHDLQGHSRGRLA